jgi:hypothetical protein
MSSPKLTRSITAIEIISSNDKNNGRAEDKGTRMQISTVNSLIVVCRSQDDPHCMQDTSEVSRVDALRDADAKAVMNTCVSAESRPAAFSSLITVATNLVEGGIPNPKTDACLPTFDHFMPATMNQLVRHGRRTRNSSADAPLAKTQRV